MPEAFSGVTVMVRTARAEAGQRKTAPSNGRKREVGNIPARMINGLIQVDMKTRSPPSFFWHFPHLLLTLRLHEKIAPLSGGGIGPPLPRSAASPCPGRDDH